jgi:hypothetical protein
MMNLKFPESNPQSSQDETFWPQLKDAIASTSGFQRWAVERGLDPSINGLALDALIHSYLRQTLETLAY